uniref:hybrid sensor histidine kinase/response regulator transcription factor n=1 Tax=Prevotella sp. TaxID=59823 RepID=UPI00402966F2
MKKPKTILIAQLLLMPLMMHLLITGCTPRASYKYKIGVSQCVGGRWRDKVNNEMLSAQHLYDTDVKVCITNADNNTDRQRQQVDSLINAGVDLLVISPNEYKPLSPCVERAKKRGIPVILFERKTSSNDYTAYIGGDNVEAGRAIGTYAARLCRDSIHVGRRPVVLEITGKLVMSPDRERYQGFSCVMKKHPELDFQHIKTNWSLEDSYAATKEWLQAGKPLDVVFCQSDLASLGAYKAAKELGKEKGIYFLGVDALPGEGIDAVQQGKLAASYIYPTHGEEIIALALRILEHKPYKRTNIIKSMVITPQNVDEIAINANAMMRQNEYLITIQNKLEDYFGLYHVQHTLLFVSLVVALILLIAVLLVWRAIVITRRANRRMEELGDEQNRFYTNASHQLRTPLTLINGPLQQLGESKTLSEGDHELLDIVQRNAEQLLHLVTDVLQFQKETQKMIQDPQPDDAHAISRRSVQDGQHDIVVRDQSDELATVLIVDDNDDMRRYLRTLLLDRYYVLEASDGQSGWKLARESVPDLVISDVMMPVMDGLTFCAKLKADPLTSHIPVILLTARSTEQQQAEGLSQGADAYLTKPFSAEVLIAHIVSLLANRQKLKEAFAAEKQQTNDNHEQDEKLSTPDKMFMDTLRQAILKNMSNTKLKMDDLGADMGISRVQLYRKVKAMTGMSPVELLKEMRLQRAMKLLKATDKTVAEVAYEVGFGTPGYFSSCFKKQYGKYPTDVKEDAKE